MICATGQSYDMSDGSGFLGGEEDCSLYIGNLSRYCRREDLDEAFKAYNVVDNLIMMKGNRSIGYGFLSFPTNEAATKCKMECDGMLINGRRIVLSWAHRNTRLLLTNFDVYITEERVHEFLLKYGNNELVQIQLGDTKASVVVEFEHRIDAEKAKQDINSKRMDSNDIRADWYSKSSQDSTDENVISVHFTYETLVLDKLVDEVCVSKVFSEFGTVLDVIIKRSFEKAKSEAVVKDGFGFVTFENNADGKKAALTAIESLRGIVFDEVKFTAEPSKNLIKTMQMERKQHSLQLSH